MVLNRYNLLTVAIRSYYLILIAGLIIGLALLLTRFTITKNIAGGDAIYYYINLRSLVIDHNVDFKNEYHYFYNQRSGFTGNRKVRTIPNTHPFTGKLPNKYNIGSTLLLIPFFLIAHTISAMLETFSPVRADGYNIIYQLSAGLGSLFYGFLTVYLIYHLGKRIFSPMVAILAACTIWFATPLIYYMTMEPLMAHSFSAFAVTFFLFYWYLIRQKPLLYQWIVLGLIGGLMSIVRYQDAFFLLIPIIDRYKLPISNLAFYLLAAIVAASPQLLVNLQLYGSYFQTGYVGEGFFYLNNPRLLDNLFSPNNGLLLWSPVVIFSLVGLSKVIKLVPRVGVLLTLGFLLQLYLVSSWSDFTQGETFGNRMLVNCTLIFALGLMGFLKLAQEVKKIKIAVFLLVGFILLNGVLAGLFTLRIIGKPY